MTNSTFAAPDFALAVRHVRDLAAARHWYAEVLGLVPEREHPTFIQFPHFAITDGEPLGTTRDAELWWQVPDIDAARKVLEGRATVIQPIQELPFGRMLGMADADGHPVYLLQWSSHRPSHAV